MRFPENPGQLGHIFKPSHNLIDTVANRQLIIDVANNPASRQGIDRFGNVWSAATQVDGTQVWVSTRNGIIQNAGVNISPETFTKIIVGP